MINRRFVRICAHALAVVFVLSILSISLDTFNSPANARVTQAQIDKLREAKKEYTQQKNEIQAAINTIEFERKTELAKKGVLDDRIMLTGLEIDNINAVIEHYTTLIREKEYEVAVAQGREEGQYQRYKNRVRDMEENGLISYLEIVFDSTNFADLLARLDFVADIMRADEISYNSFIEARNETLAAKADLEQTMSEMEEEKIYLEQKEEELLEQLEEASALILAIEQELEAERALRAMIAEEEERIQKEINAKVAELKKQEEANRAVRGTGQFVWPANGRLTSPFGWRTHPVFGGRRHHNGIDIGSPHGANVYAADSGTVLISTYGSGYGNYIVINHGNGTTTLYGHLSKRNVSAGSSVSRGQVIGLIGSTGVSTGPHLHFEVSVNGSRINPLSKL